jgi:hypothetical protein
VFSAVAAVAVFELAAAAIVAIEKGIGRAAVVNLAARRPRPSNRTPGFAA